MVIAAVVLLLAWPALKSALAKRDLTRTMNNARELYLAAFRMATDGAAHSDPNLGWPGDYPENSLADYCGKLVGKGYLKANEVQRILSAPGADCAVTMRGSPATMKLTGKSALKVYNVKGSDSSTTIFAASSNYVFDTPLNPNAVPFGDAGFVVLRKGGDARVYKSARATPAGYGKSVAKFKEQVGTLPGNAEGNVSPGDGTTVLAGPQ